MNCPEWNFLVDRKSAQRSCVYQENVKDIHGHCSSKLMARNSLQPSLEIVQQPRLPPTMQLTENYCIEKGL